MSKRANYGIDAPGVVFRFLLFGAGGTVFGVWTIFFLSRLVPSAIVVSAGHTILWTNLSFFLTGCVMLWGSLVGKLRLRDRLIADLHLRGDEQVLDVGCGHGLLLIGIAKQLRTGKAWGLDRWNSED